MSPIKPLSKRNLPLKPVSFADPLDGQTESSKRIMKKSDSIGGANVMDRKTPSGGILQISLSPPASGTPKVKRLGRSNSSLIGLGNTPNLKNMGMGNMPNMTS